MPLVTITLISNPRRGHYAMLVLKMRVLNEHAKNNPAVARR
jgi:hypothetical protein